MQFRVSIELMLHKLQNHSSPTVSTHLSELLDNETVHVSDDEYDYAFMMTTNYTRKPKPVKTQLISCKENDIAENETSNILDDSKCFYGWPATALAHPSTFTGEIHSTAEILQNNNSGSSMDDLSPNIKPKRKIRPRLTLTMRPYSCNVCARSFERKKYLFVHMQTHALKRKRYACDICGKYFVTKAYIQLHKERFCMGFAGELADDVQSRKKKALKPFECDICGQRFRLKSHVRYVYVMFNV